MKTKRPKPKPNPVGRPPAGRSATLPRCTPAARAAFTRLKAAHKFKTLVEAVEYAAKELDPNPPS